MREIGRELSEIDDEIFKRIKDIKIITNINLRSHIKEWNDLAKDFQMDENIIYPNPLTKKEVIESYNFKKIDSRATWTDLKNLYLESLIDFVKFLIEDCKDELEKTRSLFIWLTLVNLENIQSSKNPLQFTVEDFLMNLKNGKLNKSEFFQILCQ